MMHGQKNINLRPKVSNFKTTNNRQLYLYVLMQMKLKL